jgi:hypothetical protein
LSESGQRAVKTPGERAGNDRFVPNTSLLGSRSLASFCGLFSLLALGCGNAGSGLADAARNISHRTRSVEAASAADAGDTAADDDAAMDDATGEADHTTDYDPTPNGATSDDGRKLKSEPAMAVDGPHSDDDAHCGDRELQDNELCDVGIEQGMPGACPMPSDCEPLDACHAAKLIVDGCHSQCGLGDEVPCE